MTLTLVSLALAGCGYRTSFTPTNTPPRAMHTRTPSSVEILTAARPTRPFVEVGLLSSAHAGGLSTASDEEVLLGLREKAAEVGCDGVLVEAETNNYVATEHTISALKKFRAACILYTDDSKGQP